MVSCRQYTARQPTRERKHGLEHAASNDKEALTHTAHGAARAPWVLLVSVVILAACAPPIPLVTHTPAVQVAMPSDPIPIVSNAPEVVPASKLPPVSAPEIVAVHQATEAAETTKPSPPAVIEESKAPAETPTDTEYVAALTFAKAALPDLRAPPLAALQSTARSPKAYRLDGARHIYSKFPDRLFVGKLPRLILAVGVVHIDIDARGEVTAIRWARTPRNSPRVAQEIEQLVRAAAPYPAPQHMEGVTYTETWLWDKSGRFQLDTLTQGQN